MTKGNSMMTTTRLARRLGISARRVRQLIDDGVILGAVKLSRRAWAIIDERMALRSGRARHSKPGPVPRGYRHGRA
jgi:hypothetical protein